MQDLSTYINVIGAKKLMAIFPHPDDGSFVSAGLFLNAEKLGISTYLLCLTKGGRGINSYKKGDLTKIRAIYSHKSQVKNFYFRLRILECCYKYKFADFKFESPLVGKIFLCYIKIYELV
ncbi:MAG: hypothetical protein US53_C0013G0006 [Candidatus Woesebacteria bacterium GW2011_GWA1_37_7]|uniref:LmbE family protein n=2 Tax=Candidatus Woeseibacteriota TaxID=1752722 RepID=A0A0G0H6A4_9BACT|nr:MAG: hypothetical protein US53_C0013G0006 [Candidatus Woesebacteria bacterium GW2011_GWA1_37_7]OGM18766.1 MAG: hypothetical protein A2685_00445 [Candidatus Woesebacteria bacterium RIFCSPHIGHO2_01_FULL_37_10]